MEEKNRGDRMASHHHNYPIMLNLENKKAVVIGGGKVATRKIKSLLTSGAKVTVVSPKVSEEIDHLVNEGRVHWLRKNFDEEDIISAHIVIAATNNHTVNESISKHIRSAQLFNCVDQPELGNYVTPSVVRRGALTIAVSTSGASPGLSKKISEQISETYDEIYTNYVDFLATCRQIIIETVSDDAAKHQLLSRLLESEFLQLTREGDNQTRDMLFQKMLSEAQEQLQHSFTEEDKGHLADVSQASKLTKGRVYLVGAGPGDPKLLTLRALECIQQSDVIAYDRLVNPQLLAKAPQHAEKIYCGKKPNQHALIQDEINDLLVQKALEGKVVTRLKGGDPCVFGRVGEEAEVLVEQNIPFEIVPGITSGIAAPAYAGIPVTHRDHASSFAIVTGHGRNYKGEDKLNWQALAQGIDTIAFYMGIGNLAYICEQLIKYGKPEHTPVAVVHWGTMESQKTVIGTLASISVEVQKQQISHPSIVLVGDVVRLREKLKWFEKMSHPKENVFPPSIDVMN